MIISAIGAVVWTVAWRALFVTPSGAQLLLYILLGVLGMAFMVGGHIFSLIVMGGATRNLVMHLLSQEPVSLRVTYAAVRSRFWGLLAAALVMMLWIALSIVVALFGWYMVAIIAGFGTLAATQIAPGWMAAIIILIGVIAATIVAFWLFFFFVGRIAYVPQVMLVEGKSVFESVSRSFSLARGNVRRLMAMTLFHHLCHLFGVDDSNRPLGLVWGLKRDQSIALECDRLAGVVCNRLQRA